MWGKHEAETGGWAGVSCCLLEALFWIVVAWVSCSGPPAH